MERYIFVNTYLGFTTIMACRMFRGIKLGLMRMEDVTARGRTASGIVFASREDWSRTDVTLELEGAEGR